ncbi:aminopeptidase [Spiromyces aspiralis]|uniref:Aminopeptidase n=1 Tax=Spiromyces aspiralis TaxID=68401 RepID=A0ACC1HWF3_9FUNG|nr:aminopeptidase [Spiromyces aspiralis]
MPDNSVAILFSAPIYYMSPHVFYPFRQNSNFMYLTGFNEPSSAVVIEKKGNVSRSYMMTMFVQPKDANAEVWDGPRSGIEAAVDTFGADQAFSINEFGGFIGKVIKNGGSDRLVYADIPSANERQVRSESSKLLEICKELNVGPRLNPISQLVQNLRLTKSKAEVNLMREANRISAEGFKAAMRLCRPGINEQALANEFEAEFRRAARSPLESDNVNTRSGLGDGAALSRWAYVPVVASGSHALVMHYVQNNRRIRSGELVLIDAGAEFASYAADVTRTFPTEGRWASATQRDLYSAVLEVQKACLKLCNASSGYSLNELHNYSSELLRGELRRLGLQFSSNEFETRLYPHHLAHYLGLDVHDTPDMSRSQPLKPGMVVTVEPGIYIPIDPQYPKEFQGIGIRIEDNIVIGQSEEDSENLSVNCPKSVEEIEEIMSLD